MIKRLLICGIALGTAFGANAQALRTVKPAKGVVVRPTNIQLPPVKINKGEINIDDQSLLRVQAGPTVQAAAALKKVQPKTFSAVSEAIIGTSDYDLQSNVSMGKRISNNGDGTISVVYTGSQAGMGSTWADRGTFYNYFDGSSWGTPPTTRVDGARSGWPNMCVANGMEYSVAHSGGANGLILSKRTKGTGTWTNSNNAGGPMPAGGSDIWSRMAVGGANGQSLHVVVNSQGSGTAPILGQNGPVTYSRSQDGGATWDIQHIVLPGLDSSMYFGWGADVYHIDANGDNIAIALAESFGDVILMKSTDNGTTWTKTIVQPGPLGSMYDPTASGSISDVDNDGVADQVESSTGDVTVTVDPTGTAHLAWVQMVYLDDDTTAGAGWSYFPTVDGIVYWNEGMTSPLLAATAPELTGDTVISIVASNTTCRTLGYYGGSGLSAHPSIGYDASGNVYMAYSSVCEIADTNIFQQSRRHVYAVKSTDGGNTWSTPLALVPLLAQGGDGEFQEAVYPSLAKVVDSKIHVLYERDDAPGYSLLSTSTDPALQCQASNNVNRNDIVYASADVTDFVTSINEVTSPSANFSIAQNYPNPFSTYSRFEINLKKNADVLVEVFNPMGQLVSTTSTKNVAAGVTTMNLDAAGLSAGVYTYAVTVDGEKLTRMMVIQ